MGNAVILALSNILHSSVIVFTSLENDPIITIVPEIDPLSKVPVCLAFEQTGPGHYDGVTEIAQGTQDLDNIENLRETKTTNTENEDVCKDAPPTARAITVETIMVPGLNLLNGTFPNTKTKEKAKAWLKERNRKTVYDWTQRRCNISSLVIV